MKDKKILFQDKGILIYIDDDVPCLVNEWSGFIKSQNFRRYILKLLEVYKDCYQNFESKLNLLADTRALKVVAPSDIEWVANEINHQYVELGCHYEAFIVPKDAFGEASIDRYSKITTSSGIFIVNKFLNMNDAKEWLKEVQGILPT